MLPLNLFMITSALIFLTLPVKASDQSAPTQRAAYTLAELVPELSGLTRSGGSNVLRTRQRQPLLWGHNDSGHDAEVFGFNARGEVKVVVSLPLRLRDPEDIDTAPCPWVTDETSAEETLCLWVADVGDNHHRRRDAKIVVFPIPHQDVERGDSLRGESLSEKPARVSLLKSELASFTVRYPQTLPPDVEAVTVTPNGQTLLLIEKTDAVEIGVWSGTVPRVHPGAQVTINLEAHPSLNARTLELHDQEAPLPTQETKDQSARPRKVTGADLNQRGDVLFVRTYSGVWRFDAQPRQTISPRELHQSRPKLVRATRDEAQGEALCFDPLTGGLWTGTEQRGEQDAGIRHHHLSERLITSR